MSVSKRNEINLTEQYNIDSKTLVAKEKLVILAEPKFIWRNLGILATCLEIRMTLKVKRFVFCKKTDMNLFNWMKDNFGFNFMIPFS